MEKMESGCKKMIEISGQQVVKDSQIVGVDEGSIESNEVILWKTDEDALLEDEYQKVKQKKNKIQPSSGIYLKYAIEIVKKAFMIKR
jgi:hypothetical protein